MSQDVRKIVGKNVRRLRIAAGISQAELSVRLGLDRAYVSGLELGRRNATIIIDLSQWIYEEFRITVAKQTLSRELRTMGYRKLSARPRHHAQAEGAIEDFKKTSPRAWRQLRARRRLTATR